MTLSGSSIMLRAIFEDRLRPLTKAYDFLVILHKFLRMRIVMYGQWQVWKYLYNLWRKSVLKIWNIPQQTHCNLLPLICNCLAIIDEICRRLHGYFFYFVPIANVILLDFFHYMHFFRTRGFSSLWQNVAICTSRSAVFCMIFSACVSAGYLARLSCHIVKLINWELTQHRAPSFISYMLLLNVTVPSFTNTTNLAYMMTCSV